MERPNAIKSVKDLMIYHLAFELAMKIFELSKSFPREEIYSLTDQVRRSSRSVSINIREGYAKRKHEKVFRNQLIDSLGSAEESRGWLEYAQSCKYISDNQFEDLDKRYAELGAMINSLIDKWQSFNK